MEALKSEMKGLINNCHQAKLVPRNVGSNPLFQLVLESLDIFYLSDFYWDPVVALGTPIMKTLVSELT